MANAAVLSVLVTANTNQATRSLMRFNTTLRATESQSNKALGAVKTFAKVSAVGVGAAFAYSVKKAADFEQQLDSLGAVTEATGRQMEAFRKQAMKAGADTKFSALDAAQAQTELAKGGLSVRNILRGGLRSALALAAAGELDLADAASTTANAMNLFGLRGRSSIKVADALAKAANATTADVSDFAMALSQGGSVAKAAGLNFTETVLALEALAKSGIKNSDAGTSLKTALIQLIKPTQKQADLADRLNISFLDQEGRFKNLSDISEMLRKRTEGMTKAQRTATFATLAGTDGVRTLTSIYNAGAPRLDRWRKGLQQSGTAAEVAAKKQDNLKGRLENLRGSVETLAIAFGSKLLPALTDAAEKITDVLNDKSLSSAQKFNKLGEMLGKAIGAAGPSVAKAMAGLAVIGVRSFFTAFRESPLWIKLLTAGFIGSKLGLFSGVWKKAGVAAGAQMAEGVGAGTAAGMASSGTKTATGAAAGTFLGGFRSNLFALAKRGALVGAGFMIADSILGEIEPRSKLRSDNFAETLQARIAGIKLGPIEVNPDQIFADLKQKFSKVFFWEDWSKAGDETQKNIAQKLLPTLQALAKGSKAISSREARHLKEQIAGLTDIAPAARHAMNALVDESRTATQKFNNNIFEMRTNGIRSVASLRRHFDEDMAYIGSRMGFHSKKGAKAVTENFQLAFANTRRLERQKKITVEEAEKTITHLVAVYSKAAATKGGNNFALLTQAIKDTFSRVNSVSDRGIAVLMGQFRTATKLVGLDPSTAFPGIGKKLRTSPRLHQLKQRGGPINAGAPSGDTVPAMLERGEYVLNRKAVARVGKQKLDAVNFANAPRFQAGGLAGMVGAANRVDKAHFPYVWGGGHSASPAPFGPFDCSGAVSYVLQHGGVKIPTMVSGALAGAGQPGPGKVTVFANSGHTFMRIGNRYFGTSGSNPGGGAGWFPDPGSGYRSGFTQRHFAATGDASVAGVSLLGPESSLKNVAQGALDNTTRGINQRLRNLESATIGRGDAGDPGPFSGGGTAAQNRKLGLQMAKARGWGGGNWRALDRLWTGESGWRTTADNPASDAYGIPQALPGSKMASAGADWATNPATQIKWGLDYIAGRYGDPRNAYNQWLARSPHWYQAGGQVGANAHWGAVGEQGASRLDRKRHGGHAPLGKLLKKTLKVLRTSPKAKVRGKQLRKFEDRVRKMGLPKGINNQLAMLSTAAETYGDYADKASQLNVDNEDGTTTLGMFRTGDEQSWLTKQLDALFKWRNKLADAIKVVQKRRDQIHKLIVQAQKRLAFVKDRIAFAVKSQRGLRKTLKELQKHPKQNKDKIAAYKANIKHGDDWLKGRTRERKLLGDRILPGLANRRDTLGEQYDTLSGSEGLEGVQGPGGSKKHLRVLPPLGVLGGSIFDVQLRLRDLAAPKVSATDNSPVTDEATTAMLRELLRQANLRTAVSEAQFKTLRGFDATSGAGFMGSFAKGGVALVGERGPELAHLPSGTRVHSTDDTQRMMAPNVQVHINGDIHNVPRGKDPVEVVINDRRFKAAVAGSRLGGRTPLPGARG